MKKPTEYVKMRVLAAIEMAEGKTIRARIRKVSETTFYDEDGCPHSFTWRTLETWRTRYNKHGITACEAKPRTDRGSFRKIEPERVQEAIEQARAHLRPDFKISQLYRTCIEQGYLRREQIAPNTFRRILKKYDLLQSENHTQNKRRLAFSKRHANEAWQVDTLFGPFVKKANGKSTQTKLIAFIDDASRVLCHGEFFFTEDIEALKATLRTALYKRGIPQCIYADNGSIYKAKNLSVICARLGTQLRHTPVRDGAAKGKIERFFRTCRDQFLSQKLDLNTLATLNTQFTHWAEEHYNHRKHSTLQMKPIERFGLDHKRIQYLPPCAANDELFYPEEKRVTLADNTFKFQAHRFECPHHLPNREIQVRYNPHTPKPNTPIVYYKNERIGESQQVDFIANDRFNNQPQETRT